MESCPKCSRPAKAAELACARCGLLRSRWQTYKAQQVAHPVLDPLWQQALLSWEDKKRHSALAVIAGQDFAALSVLAQRYSAVLRERPEDKVAASSLDHLIQVAMTLPAPAHSAPGRSGLWRAQQVFKAVLGLSMMALAFFLFLTLMRR